MILHRLVEQFLLLPQRLGVSGVKFQQLLHVLELLLRVPDLGVDILERLGKRRRVAADLYGDSPDFCRHAAPPFFNHQQGARNFFAPHPHA